MSTENNQADEKLIKGIVWSRPPKVLPADVPYSGTPFSSVKSEPPQGFTYPLVDHEVGAGMAFRKRERMISNYSAFLKSHLGARGESSAFVQDWAALTAVTQKMVQSVVAGDASGVAQAIKAGADPHMLVNVQDPNKLGDHNTYIQLPVGVAAVMLGQQKAEPFLASAKAAKGSGDHEAYALAKANAKAAAAPFAEVARALILSGNQPGVEVGLSPYGAGYAISYHQPGFHIVGPDAGSESIETRCVSIPLSLSTALSGAVPEAYVSSYVAPSTEGVMIGEEFPDETPSAMRILDVPGSAVDSGITAYRARLGGGGGGGGAGIAPPRKLR